MKHHDAMVGPKALFKKYPRLYRALTYIFAGPPSNTTASQFVQSLPRDIKIVDVGSGPRKLRYDVTCVDIIKFDNVDIVADAAHLPFENESVDAIISDNVLEHTRNPRAIVAEMTRVLKKGGLAYVAVPYVIPFHSSPDDFYRWSEQGLREEMRDFEEEELKIQFGPSAAMTMVLAEWLALLFSFNNGKLHAIVLYIATILTTPLKIFDFLLSRYTRAGNIALTFYFIGRKK